VKGYLATTHRRLWEYGLGSISFLAACIQIRQHLKCLEKTFNINPINIV
jgi:hypothetical protein